MTCLGPFVFPAKKNTWSIVFHSFQPKNVLFDIYKGAIKYVESFGVHDLM